jgi:xylose isomerase
MPIGAYTRERAMMIKERQFDRQALASRPLPYERLDQLVIDLLLGVR